MKCLFATTSALGIVLTLAGTARAEDKGPDKKPALPLNTKNLAQVVNAPNMKNFTSQQNALSQVLNTSNFANVLNQQKLTKTVNQSPNATNIVNTLNTKNLLNVVNTSVPNVKNTVSVLNTKNIINVQSTTKKTSVTNVTSVQSVQSVQNVQSVTSMQSVVSVVNGGSKNTTFVAPLPPIIIEGDTTIIEQPAAKMFQFEKLLVVKNETKEAADFFVLYHSKADGWLPSAPDKISKVVRFSLAPGEAFVLTDGDKFLPADKVRIGAKSMSKSWLDGLQRDVFLVEPDAAGLRRYEGEEMGIFLFQLKE